MKTLPEKFKNCIKSDFINYVPPRWDVLFMKMAYLAATKSKDPRTKIGAQIVGPDHEPISFGYNGIPRGVNDLIEKRHERPTKYMYFEHAERNAIYTLPRLGVKIPKGSIMYTNGIPCCDCGRGIIQAGISVVMYHTPYEEICNFLSSVGRTDWEESARVTSEMFHEAGVKLKALDDFIDVKGYVNGKVIEV